MSKFRKIVTVTDVVVIGLAALLIWAGQGGVMDVLSGVMYIFAGMLLGVAINKVAARFRTAHQVSKAKK